MHLKIRHRTEYRYEKPVHYSIQELRLTPSDVAGQKIDKWKVTLAHIIGIVDVTQRLAKSMV